jgi:GTPase SAR1 family protein
MEPSEIYDGTMSENFRCIVSGSSGCGKSTLIQKLMINQNGLYPHDFDNIVYCYGVKTKDLKILEEHFGEVIQFFDHIPDNLIEVCSKGKHNLCILEDLDEESFSSPQIALAFTRWSHHHQFCLLLSTQNLFSSGSKRLTLMRNATHVILFPNYLDHSVPRLLAQRILPTKPQIFLQIYDHATRQPYGYLAIFGTGPRTLQFRSEITCPTQKVFLVQ